MKPHHVSVCICTYQRPALLRRLLEKLEHQQTGGAFTYGVVVADNDAGRSAEEPVASFASRSHLEVVYCCEPRQNIALARNQVLAHADGEFIAFIDDDEFPADDWLAKLLEACARYGASGVLGPVRPHFDAPPPRWIVRGRFCERPEHPTGTVMHWIRSRTGNVLFRRAILDGTAAPFRSEFGTGGEDKDFFMRMTQRGCVFVWCNEAIAYETVPPARWTRRYMLTRALLRGKNVLRHPTGRGVLVAKSLVALPVYSLALPVTLLFGQHVFMKFGIRFCDHLGRLLAVVGLNPINERPM
ncbi:MAG TPA: glycosyltransferase family A protein [Opitutaceae bacterium]|nr:glycosyltransferase family A protein [Opitutaceae bacterium]